MPINQSGDTLQMTVPTDIYFCFGFGYVAEYLAKSVLADGATVYGTSRSMAGKLRVSAFGGRAYGRLFTEDKDIEIPENAHWIISIPPDEDGCPAYRAAFPFAETAESITYLSSTGVYGDRDGGWVFENTPTSPQSDRSKRRVVAENQWKRFRANIARLPGIYGPGRSALDRVKTGTARRIVKPGQVFSRGHVEDIASGLRLVAERKLSRHILHFCDDEPAPPQDVILHAAKLLGIQPPAEEPIGSAKLSEMGKSFYAECKRVSNVATKMKLNWQPKYPSYREGLAAIMKAKD